VREVSTENAPDSIGPYSQAIADDTRVYVSGQGPIDPASGDIVGSDAAEQADCTLANIAAVLDAAGSSIDDVLKSTVFLTDMSDYDAVNEIYADHMSDPYPARSAVEVSDLPVDIRVEIEVIARV